MKYRDLQIQTLRGFPSNARTQGFGWLVRAGYITRENELLPLGEQVIERLRALSNNPSFFFHLSSLIISNEIETYFPISTGSIEVANCSSCEYTMCIDLARFVKTALHQEEQFPLEKVLTPNCNTIEALANFLNVPKEKTAKALMYTRLSDNKFIFVVVRGDMQLSEAKLKQQVGDIRPATVEEITKSGAAAGYASPIGLRDMLIVVDDLIPGSQNLVAGANEIGYHLKNTNYGRDYSAEIVVDLVQAKAGDMCPECGKPIFIVAAELLAKQNEFYFDKILLALAETHHDDKGLTFPKSAAPFDVYLMHITGKELDTCAKAEELYNTLQSANISVLFDNRDERAGVKFNDADLIGCSVRLTVGEKNLREGMVELKERKAKENKLVEIDKITGEINHILK